MEKMYFETAPFEELCGCVVIDTTESERQRLAFADSKGNRDGVLKRLFEDGRQRNYLANCPNCENGIAK